MKIELSDREQEVFDYLADGLTTGQIAKKIFRSVKTVETYVAQLRIKLDLESIHQVRYEAMKAKLIK